MILDHIKNASLYYALDQRLAAALQALQTDALLHAAPGRHELQGGDVFALVQRYDSKPREQGKWEAHRKFIDVQYVVAGAELIGYAPAADLQVTEPYNADKDILFLAGQGDYVTLSAGMFAILFPHDGHMPGLAIAAPAPVHKIVVKVRAA